MSRRILLAGTVVLTLLAAAPGTGAAAGAGNGGGLAVFAADAEAWALSVEVGILGSLGSRTSHTKASIDNSPHAVGVAGLVDPGLLVGAAGEVMFGVPTPAHCESAAPDGPPEAKCAAPAVAGGAQVGQAHTRSSDRPEATSTARSGPVIFNEAGRRCLPSSSIASRRLQSLPRPNRVWRHIAAPCSKAPARPEGRCGSRASDFAGAPGLTGRSRARPPPPR